MLANRHPDYMEFQLDWEMCRDVYRGERVIKDHKTKYLQPTAGMYADGYPNAGSKGLRDYTTYIERARFHNFSKKAVLHYMGLLWHKEPGIELPPRMEVLRESCTRKGESMLQLLRVIHEEMLVTGRLGLYADMPTGQTFDAIAPYIAFYKAESILNWDEGQREQVVKDSMNLVVLNESCPERQDDFSWKWVRKYRILVLGDIRINEEADTTANFTAGVFNDEDDFDPSLMIEPKLRGVPLKHIPFVFCNGKDLNPTPDDPPLLDLVRHDLGVYRGEADYRNTLFLQSQYTLAIIGDGDNAAASDPTNPDSPVRTGAGSVIRLSNPAADVKYVGIDGVALPEQRAALENDNRKGEMMSGSLTDTRTNEAESGDAMDKRQAGESTQLINIAITGALALQSILRSIAMWMGEDPETVVVTPNKEFTYERLTPQDLLFLQQGKTAGLPISDESIHENVQRSGYTDKDYEDEKAAIDQEEPRIDATGVPLNAPLSPIQNQTLKNLKKPPAPAGGSKPGAPAKPPAVPKS